MEISKEKHEKQEQVVSNLRREIILLEGRLIKLNNSSEKNAVLIKEIEPKFIQTRKAFSELLELTLEYRERLGYVDNADFEYEFCEKAGLL